MSNSITRTYTFANGGVADGGQVDSEIQNIVNTINNADAGTTIWTAVKGTTITATSLLIGANAFLYTPCAAYTPTFAGFGTVTNVSFFWCQIGDTIFIRGTLKTATTAASTASFTIPSGKTIDTTKIPSATANTAMSGMFVTNSASPYITANFMGIVFSDGSTTDKLFFALTGSAAAGATKGNGNAVSQDSSYMMIQATIPIS